MTPPRGVPEQEPLADVVLTPRPPSDDEGAATTILKAIEGCKNTIKHAEDALENEVNIDSSILQLKNMLY